MFASDGVVRPYDRERTGTALGAASVGLVVEAADSVYGRGGSAYCEVAGTAHSGCPGADAAAATMERVVRDGLERAGESPAGIDYCAGFGSGAAHDGVELRALGSVFSDRLMVSAPKSLTGECEAASGAANLLVGALALAGDPIPGTANLDTPDTPDTDGSTGAPVSHVPRPSRRSPVSRVIANACSPTTAYGSAVLASLA